MFGKNGTIISGVIWNMKHYDKNKFCNYIKEQIMHHLS
jgi:hypothetical protein